MANSLTKFYDDLPRFARILIQVFLGSVVGGVYRILRYVENKNNTTLIAGILALVPVISFVFWVVDLVTVILHDKINIFAD